MKRLCKDFLGACPLDDLSLVHHRNPAGDFFNDPQVMRNKKIRQSKLLLQLQQQINQLSLDQDIQGRNRLIQNEELRIHSQGPGQRDPLALAAGELMGKAIQDIRRQSHG